MDEELYLSIPLAYGAISVFARSNAEPKALGKSLYNPGGVVKIVSFLIISYELFQG